MWSWQERMFRSKFSLMKSLEKIGPGGKREGKPNSKSAKRKTVYSYGRRREVDHHSQDGRAVDIQDRGEPTLSQLITTSPLEPNFFSGMQDTSKPPAQRVEDSVTLGRVKAIKGDVFAP